MSKFIKRHEDIAQARCQARRAARAGSSVGFTEAELEAAKWARKLPEVQMQISRRTNGDLRGRPKGIVAKSRQPSAAKPSAALEEEFLAELAEIRQREEKKKERKERKQKKERRSQKNQNHEDKKKKLEKLEGEAVEMERPAAEDKELVTADQRTDKGPTGKEQETSGLRDEESPKQPRKPPAVDEEKKMDRGATQEKDKKNKKEKKERKKERRERRERRREKRERHDKEEKGKDGERRSRGFQGLELEGPDVGLGEAKEVRPPPEPGSLEAKALEMKMQRKQARQMRREQRQLKREEHERLRQEMAEANGWQDAIGQLIEAAEAQSRAYSAAKAEPAPVIDIEDEPADPAGSRDAAPPLRSLEQLVKELDELERLKKEAKKQKAKAKTADGAQPGREATEGTEEGAKDAEGNALPQPVPNDPLNPLNAAYDMRAYALLRKMRLEEEHQISQIALDEPDWDHLGYLRRSPSPCRIRTKGTMWPTRKGAWRSRAGGVYLPPEADVERRGSPSLSPARWMYPEEFNRPLQKARRSPSYTRFEREEISSSSSDSSSSSSTIPRRRKRRKASSSRASRPSPTYQPDE